MGEKTPRWETELWSYLSRGDGVHCPVYDSCKLRLGGLWCLSDHQDYYEERNRLIDNDDPDLDFSASIEFQFHGCPRGGRIFQLVSRLAARYQTEAGIKRLPVPTNLVTYANDNLPIEIRWISLKAYHGAVWRLNDCWLIHLNNKDTPARQRFTLYHEIFHILAHGRGAPVFKKTSYGHEGTFNELLADHFAAVILLPEKLVKEKWSKVKDVSRMARIFDVPGPVMYFGLRAMRLL